MNQHLGIKPYNCKYCPQAFSDPSSKRRHERETHEEVHIYCPIAGCDHKNKRRTGLISHMQSVHKITDPAALLAAQDAETKADSRASSPGAEPYLQLKQEQLSPPAAQLVTPPTLTVPMPLLAAPTPRLPSQTDSMMREFLIASVFDSPRASQALPGPVPMAPLAPQVPVQMLGYDLPHFHNPWNPHLLMPPHAATPYASHPQTPYASHAPTPYATPYAGSPSPSPAIPMLPLPDVAQPLFTNAAQPTYNLYAPAAYDPALDLTLDLTLMPFLPLA